MIEGPKCITIFNPVIVSEIDLEDAVKSDKNLQNVSSSKVDLSVIAKAGLATMTENGLFVLATLSGRNFDTSHKITTPPRIRDATDAKSFIFDQAKTLTDQSGTLRPAIGIKTYLLARAIDRLSSASHASFQATFEMPTQKFGTEIRLAKKPEFACDRLDCSQKRCTKPNCHNKTEKTCINAGGDIAKALNKTCKEVVNVVCDGGRAASDLICNTIQVLDKASCDMGEVLKKAGCETNKILSTRHSGASAGFPETIV